MLPCEYKIVMVFFLCGRCTPSPTNKSRNMYIVSWLIVCLVRHSLRFIHWVPVPFPISHLTVPSSQFVCQHLRFWALAPGFLVPGIWYLVWLTLIVNLAYGFFIFVARLDHKSYFAPGDRLRIRRQGRTHLRCLWIPFGAVVLRLRGLGKCNQSQIAEIII